MLTAMMAWNTIATVERGFGEIWALLIGIECEPEPFRRPTSKPCSKQRSTWLPRSSCRRPDIEALTMRDLAHGHDHGRRRSHQQDASIRPPA